MDGIDVQVSAGPDTFSVSVAGLSGQRYRLDRDHHDVLEIEDLAYGRLLSQCARPLPAGAIEVTVFEHRPGEWAPNNEVADRVADVLAGLCGVVDVAVIGTYPLKGSWIEVHCDHLPRGYGRLALERIAPDGSTGVHVECEYTRHAWALQAAEALVLARGGQLGQDAAAVAGGPVEKAMARRMFTRRELVRWIHLGPDGGAGPPAAA